MHLKIITLDFRLHIGFIGCNRNSSFICKILISMIRIQMSAQAVLRSVHLSTVATVVAGCATVVLVLEVPFVVPHMFHCCSTLETLDPPINVNHGVACSGVKFTLKKREMKT